MIGFHGGKDEIERPRVRWLGGAERVLPSWESAVSEDWLGKWAMNQMLINVSTLRFKRSVRLPEGDVPACGGAGLSKSATPRRFVTLSAARTRAWMETRLDDLELMAILRDRKRDDGAGAHRQSRRAWTRSNRATPVHHRWREGALQGDPPHLWKRCGDPTLPDSQGAQHSGAVAKIDARFGAARLAASLGKWTTPKRPKRSRNLGRLERDWNGVCASILEGIDEMLTVQGRAHI